MDQVANTLWPYPGPVLWSCPRSEAVLHRSTNSTGQSGFMAPAPLFPRAAGMLLPGNQHPRGGKGQSKNCHSTEPLFGSCPWNHFTSACGTPDQCNRYQGHEVQQLYQRASYKPGKWDLPQAHNRRKDDSTGELNSLSNISSEHMQQQSSMLQREPRTSSLSFETFWQRLDEFLSLGVHYKNFQNPFTTS